MDITDSIVQKVTDLLLWDDITRSQQCCIVESKNSVVSSRISGEQTPTQNTLYILENRCGKAGLEELAKITSGLNWQDVSAFIFITDRITDVKNMENNIPVFLRGQGELYGVDPDYFFSLVPLKGVNHKRIENFIVSLESRALLKEKIKYFVKKILILLNLSSALYERYVYCVYCDKPHG